MLPTPQGLRWISGYEQVMIVQSACRFVKLLRSKALAEATNIHYEGPEIIGDGIFHKMSLKEQIVALYLVFKNCGDKHNQSTQAEWKNSALECLYSWMLHEIAQEFGTPSQMARINVGRTYQYNVDPNKQVNNNNTDFGYWADIVGALAKNVVYTAEDWKKVYDKEEKEELLITEELFNSASLYFDDAEATAQFPV